MLALFLPDEEVRRLAAATNIKGEVQGGTMMEKTNYVARAKALMMEKARASALVVVPLAAAIGNAQANGVTTPTLTAGTASCSTSSSVDLIRTSPCAAGSSQNSGTTVNGVSLYIANPVSYVISGAGIETLSLSASGVLSGGSLPSTIPVEWNFTLSGISGWTLQYQLTDITQGNAVIGSFTTSGPGAGTIGGSASMSVTGSDSVNDVIEETATLTTGCCSSAVTISVPEGGSFDFGPQTTAAPEPASVGFMAGGLALLGTLLRRYSAKKGQ